MEKFLLSNFTAEQKWILTRRFQGISYTRIRETWPFGERQSLHNQNIISCVRRSALGYAWSKGMKGGSDRYLCPADLEDLKMQIVSAANDGSPLDTSLVIDKAFELKKARYVFAKNFVIAMHSEVICKEIDEKSDAEKPPVRSWVNGILEKLLISIKTARYVDILRIISCTPDSIASYFEYASAIIEKFHKFLIFGADETMLFPSVKRKAVLPAEITHEFITAQPTLPHFSAMCSHNLFGEQFANFVILPGLKKPA